VVPTNIEKYLMTHPAVEDAAVVGRPDDVDGELPTAFVVVRKGQSTTAEEIIQFIQGSWKTLSISPCELISNTFHILHHSTGNFVDETSFH